MTNVVLPFLMSMLLGRTIDLRTYTISGTNVYDDADFEETPINVLNTTYNVIQGNSFPYMSYGIPTDIVLRIKSNFLSSSSGAMGLDGILKDTSWKQNSVVVSVTSVYRTVERRIPKEASPLADWADKVSLSQTHYADRFIYGGWSVVLFRFKCDIPSDVTAVRKILTEHLGVQGSLDPKLLVKWNEALENIRNDSDIRGTVTPTTHVYSTVEFKDFIDSPETLLKSIQDLPGVVGSLGQPLFMDLKPLNDLDKKYAVVSEDVETLGELEKLDEMMDDVRNTKVSVMRWMQETLTAFDEEQEAKIYDLLTSLNECIRAFSKVASEVSLFSAMDRQVLDNAYHLYLSKLERGLPNYNMVYMRLKEDIDAECSKTFLHKIRGLLRVYDEESRKMGKVEGGLQECQTLCSNDEHCRSIGFAETLSELDLATGLYLKKENQCWIYHRSTSTATVYTPNGLSGDLGVYDRRCY